MTTGIETGKEVRLRQSNEIEDLSERQRAALEEFKQSQDDEMSDLKASHLNELDDIIDTVIQSPGCCKQCKVVTVGPVKEFGYTVCYSCFSPYCKLHSLTACSVDFCNKVYCKECIEIIPKCSDHDGLKCCFVSKQVCGLLVCDDCEERHEKVCGCHLGMAKEINYFRSFKDFNINDDDDDELLEYN